MKTYVHVSFEVVESFVPRIPQQVIEGKEDSVTKRICAAPDVISALNAVPEAGFAIQGMQILNMPVIVHAYYLSGEFVKPTTEQVPDQEQTGEMWLINRPSKVHRVDYRLENILMIKHTDKNHITQPYLVGCKLKRTKFCDNAESLRFILRNNQSTKLLAQYSFRTIAANIARYYPK